MDWLPAIEADRELRDGAEIAELTHLVDLSAYPEGTRMIVRRERPHPGAQLSLFDTVEGMRHQVFITDTPRPACSVQRLELRHRGHAQVEDRIRTGKDTGFGRFPSRRFAINAAWLQLALVGIDLLAWTRTLLLDGEHAVAEPKKLRYRLLHVAARLDALPRPSPDSPSPPSTRDTETPGRHAGGPACPLIGTRTPNRLEDQTGPATVPTESAGLVPDLFFIRWSVVQSRRLVRINGRHGCDVNAECCQRCGVLI
jgi:hypothetical protein